MIEKLTPERFIFKQGLRWGLLEFQNMLNSRKYTTKEIQALLQAILRDLEVFMEYGDNVWQCMSPRGSKQITCKIYGPGYSANQLKAAKAIDLLIGILQNQ